MRTTMSPELKEWVLNKIKENPGVSTSDMVRSARDRDWEDSSIFPTMGRVASAATRLKNEGAVYRSKVADKTKKPYFMFRNGNREEMYPLINRYFPKGHKRKLPPSDQQTVK